MLAVLLFLSHKFRAGPSPGGAVLLLWTGFHVLFLVRGPNSNFVLVPTSGDCQDLSSCLWPATIQLYGPGKAAEPLILSTYRIL